MKRLHINQNVAHCSHNHYRLHLNLAHLRSCPMNHVVVDLRKLVPLIGILDI